MRNATSTQLQKMQFYQKFFSSEAVFIYLGVILVLLGEKKYKFQYIFLKFSVGIFIIAVRQCVTINTLRKAKSTANLELR